MIVIESKIQDRKVIVSMSDMRPLQLGRIVSGNGNGNKGKIVMRTATTLAFEVISLSDFTVDSCWTSKRHCEDIMVEIDPDPKLNLVLSI